MSIPVKVKFTRNTSVAGQHYSVGQTGDIPDQDAALLVSMGKAVLLEKVAEKIQTREPSVETREPEIDAMTTGTHSGAKPKKSRIFGPK